MKAGTGQIFCHVHRGYRNDLITVKLCYHKKCFTHFPTASNPSGARVAADVLVRARESDDAAQPRVPGVLQRVRQRGRVLPEELRRVARARLEAAHLGTAYIRSEP